MKTCDKVKFASIQAIKDHLRLKKEVGETTPYYCHVCCAYHYTSKVYGLSLKIERLEAENLKMGSEIVNLKKKIHNLETNKGLTQIKFKSYEQAYSKIKKHRGNPTKEVLTTIGSLALLVDEIHKSRLK